MWHRISVSDVITEHREPTTTLPRSPCRDDLPQLTTLYRDTELFVSRRLRGQGCQGNLSCFREVNIKFRVDVTIVMSPTVKGLLVADAPVTVAQKLNIA